jgi:hypothetical protein
MSEPSTDPLRDETKDLLEALRQWEYWYSVDSSEFNRDNARENGLKLLKKHRAWPLSKAALGRLIDDMIEDERRELDKL